MCNRCGNSTCYGNCYPSVPNQWNTCAAPPVPCPPAPCIPCPTTGLNLLYARVLTTNLELYQMPLTPKVLIAAPGAGKLIVPLQIWNSIVVNNPAVPYQDVATLTPTLVMGLGSVGIASDSAILGSLVDQTTYYVAPSLTTPGNLANQPFTLSTISQPIVGDSNLYSYIIYTIVNI